MCFMTQSKCKPICSMCLFVLSLHQLWNQTLHSTLCCQEKFGLEDFRFGCFPDIILPSVTLVESLMFMMSSIIHKPCTGAPPFTCISLSPDMRHEELGQARCLPVTKGTDSNLKHTAPFVSCQSRLSHFISQRYN